MDPAPAKEKSVSPTSNRLRLGLECSFFFIGIPVILYLNRIEFSRLIIPVLLISAPLCLFYLLRDKSFDRSRLWRVESAPRHWLIVLARFGLLSLPLIAWVYYFDREHFFRFPRHAPRGWIMVMLLYPLLSVYPQELIFRTFFFQRYSALFPTPATMIIASALAFGMAHLFFANWIAVTLSILGGILFASTYRRSRSTLAAVVEHGLWGDFLFTLGLGWYFYGGSIRAASGS